MELSQLRMLKAVAESGSVVRAADLLHCVPSNVTARIKALESELGIALFHRAGRGLRITSAGEVYLDYADRILALAAEAKRAVDPSSTPSGPLKIGAIESSATGRLPRLLARFHARFPGVSLQLVTGTWQQLIDEVQHNRLDGAIVAVEVNHPRLSNAVIYEESLVLIASKSLGQLGDAKDLQGKTIFMWPPGCPYRAALERWLHGHGLNLPIVSYASYGTIAGCVGAGAGVSLVPKGIYHQYAQAAELIGLEFPDLAVIQNRFIWHKQAGRHSARDAFIAMLHEEFTLAREQGGMMFSG
ncbi:HTH-type transcriptional regulator GltR [mine drainage metagenome]|uniref:HTH-type transcriptional regulator GltR n=1 Tax=mine drainage metagenome TaxID=410659 RepID=A0A1J5PA12_9ZZZZ